MQSTFRFAAPRRSGKFRTATIAFSLAMLIAASATSASLLTKSYSFANDSVIFAQDTINGTVYDVVTMSGCAQDQRAVGAPQLPQRAVVFLIPYGEKLDSVTAVAASEETLAGPFNPIPIQPPGDTSAIFYPPFLYYYESGYPAGHADGAQEGFMATYRMASFFLRPLLYLPDGQLVKAQQLTVSIYTSPDPQGFGGLTQARRSMFGQEELSRTVQDMVENPECVDWGYQVPVVPPQSPLVISQEPGPSDNYVDCVIVTLQTSAAEYERYAEFLTERGIVTTVRTLEWIHAHPLYHGADKAASVRNFLKAAYFEWGTLYAILAGWQTDLGENVGLPMRMIQSYRDDGVDPWFGWATTDAYFADLEGSWNENGNRVYGEGPTPGMAAFYFTDELHGCGVAPVEPYSGFTNAFLTYDGGAHWSSSATMPPYGAYVYDMDFVGGSLGWCVGSWPVSGTQQVLLCRTVDGGYSWHVPAVGPGIAGDLHSVHFVDAAVGWAVGWQEVGGGVVSIILHTTDGGNYWTTVPSPLSEARLHDVEFSASGQYGWITANSDVILRTTDGGASWAATSVPGNGSHTRYVSFADESVGWATGNASFGSNSFCAVWATTDGGASWQLPVQLGNPGYAGTDIQAVRTEGNPPSYDVWAITKKQVFHRDQQTDWDTQYTTNSILNHIQFLDANHGWAAGPAAPRGHLATTNGGNDWSEVRPDYFRGDWSIQECMPELTVGRLPSKPQNGEAQTVVNKLVTCQTSPPSVRLKRVTLCVGDFNGWQIPWNDDMTQEPWFVAAGLDVWKVYEPRRDPFPYFNRDGTLGALNDGFQFITHLLHAGHTYWECKRGDPNQERIRWDDFDNGTVHNGDMTGIAVAQGCNALYMLGDGSLGRHFLTCPTGGAVAYVGSAVSNRFEDPPTKVMYYNLLKEVYGRGVTRLGAAFTAAVTTKRDVGRGRAYENLLGDPLMDIWTNAPGSFDVSHELNVPPQPGPFEVTVLNHDTQVPVGGALVCLCMYDPLTGAHPVYYRQKTDPSGRALFSIAPEVTGEIVVTVTKHDYLPHTSSCHVGLFTGDPNATANGQQRNIARVAGTDILHLVYTDQGFVMHSVSMDAGRSWQRPEPVALGDHPAITLNYPSAGSGTVRTEPWVTYRQGDDIWLAVLHQGSPPSQLLVFNGTTPDSLAHPAAIAAEPLPNSTGPSAWIAYEVSGTTGALSWSSIRVVRVMESGILRMDVLETWPIEFECSQPSIAITPGNIIHVAWQRLNNTAGSSIYYSEFRTSWTMPPFQVSQPTFAAYGPFVETYGDSVWCAWESPATSPDVYRRGRWLQWPHWMWNPQFVNVSQSPVASARPVMVGRDICAWQEGGNDPGEVLLEIGGEIHNLSNSPALNSAYPSIEFRTYDMVSTVTVYAAWTEAVLNQPYFEVKSTSFDWNPTDGPGKSLSTYYAVATGDSVASPYCGHRTGAVTLGPYSLDYGVDSLSYRLPYLDPQYDYYMRAVLYQEGRQYWRERVRVDDSLDLVVPFQPRKPESLWVQIPPGCYRRDAVAPIHISRSVGEYGVLTDFTVERREPARSVPQGREGGQIAPIVPLRLEFRPAAPNPFRRSVQLRFGLNRAGHVSLRVFDASGRMVREFTAGELPAGYHCVAWDGHDAVGRRLAAGTYFVRLSAEKQSVVQKVVLSR